MIKTRHRATQDTKYRALLLALLFSVVSSVEAQTETDLIEATVLWRVELAPDWTPVELAELLTDESRFEAEGNFYKLLVPISAFGGVVSYVGLLGVDMLPGPNVVVEAAPAQIADYLAEKYELEFESDADNSAFQADLQKDVKLLIGSHPSIEGSSIVIGAYLGP